MQRKTTRASGHKLGLLGLVLLACLGAWLWNSGDRGSARPTRRQRSAGPSESPAVEQPADALMSGNKDPLRQIPSEVADGPSPAVPKQPAPQEPVDLQKGSIRGRVVDLRGVGVEGAEVLATGLEELLFVRSEQRPRRAYASTRTGAGGRFRLNGLPPGALRLWAGAQGYPWVRKNSLRVLPGKSLAGVKLRLLPYGTKNSVQIYVLDPEGNPPGRAILYYRYSESGRSGSGVHRTNAEGAHLHVFDRKLLHHFLAVDGQGRYRPVARRGVEPGSDDLVLELGKPRALRIALTGTGGKALHDFSVRVHWVGENPNLQGRMHEHASDAGQPAALSLQLPFELFELELLAAGHAKRRAGPFDPDLVGESLVLSMEPLGTVNGTVVDGLGQPLAGVRVGLHGVRLLVDRRMINGFPVRSQRHAVDHTLSASDGSFQLTIQKSDSYYLRGTKAGLAPGELGALVLAPDVGARDLRLMLGGGGTLEGFLRGRPGQIVGISRGDSFGKTQRADVRGHFRFEHLTPGLWQVELREEELDPFTTRGGRSPQPLEFIPWNCEVFEGQVTRMDLGG